MLIEKVCPVCRVPLGVFRTFMRTAWSQWHCESCGSLLGMNKKRRFLAIAIWIAVLFGWMYIMRRSVVPMPLVVLSLCVLGFVTIAAIDRVRVIERRGAHCTGCGYDLRAIEAETECPECGRTIDDEIRALAGRIQQALEVKRRPREVALWVFLVMMILFSLTMLIVGLTRFRAFSPTGQPPAAPTNVDSGGP